MPGVSGAAPRRALVARSISVRAITRGLFYCLVYKRNSLTCITDAVNVRYLHRARGNTLCDIRGVGRNNLLCIFCCGSPGFPSTRFVVH